MYYFQFLFNACELRLEQDKKEEKNKEEIEKERSEYKSKRNEKIKSLFEVIKENYVKFYKKEMARRSKLNKRVKFVLQMLSRYKFRQHLSKNKSIEYGCEMIFCFNILF